MSHVIFLAGPPGSGKSTFYYNYLIANFPRVSSDAYIEEWCRKEGITYAQGFDKFIQPAQEAFTAGIEQLQQSSSSFVVDRTNLTEQSRKRLLQTINPRYKKTIVYFPSYTKDLLQARIASRVQNGGHDIPEHVIESMLSSYTIPRYSEGWDWVVGVHEFIRIKELGIFNGL